MFLADKVKAEVELMPLAKEIADQLWKTSRHKYTAADIGHIRVLQGSPLEDALHFLEANSINRTI
jgi:phage FluMu gp28-like protein